MRWLIVVGVLGCAGEEVAHDALEWTGDVVRSPPAGDLSMDILSAEPGGLLEVEITGLGPYEQVFLLRGGEGGGACPAVLGGVCLELREPSVLVSGYASPEGVALLAQGLPDRPGLLLCLEGAARRGPSGIWSGTTGAECVELGAVSPCDPATEVEHEGRCYYLDGSGGACEPGYTLAPQSVLDTIASDFVGVDYKTAISGNCCIWHRDQDVELQDWGMDVGCNAPGPFGEGPVPGGAGCSDALNLDARQLTLCMSD